MSGRNFLYELADNFVGYDDGVTTPGERFGTNTNALLTAIYDDPLGVAFGIGNHLNHLMFEGGAMQSPFDVMGYAAAPMAPGAMSGRAVNVLSAGGAKPGIKAYHGSPHDFDKFSMDKIGTGEGAQAYGHGLYFAENEGVARGYRDALSYTNNTVNKQIFSQTNASELYRGLSVDDAKTLDGILGMIDGAPGLSRARIDIEEMPINAQKLFEDRIAPLLSDAPRGSMYEVNINANPDDFLDYDAPLSQQGPRVQQSWEDYTKKNPQWLNPEDVGGQYRSPTGQDFIGAYSEDVPHNPADMFDYSRKFTDDMSKQGIPGIKYRDAGSRGLDGETGTRNYVVFDENLINIVRKYGIAGAATALGVSASDVQAAMAQGQQQ